MIQLLTAATPNGQKVSIALEEMELPYSVRTISLAAQEQKEPWFLSLNPNGRIPVIQDDDEDEFPVFESGAILIYLAEKTGRFLPGAQLPSERKARSRVLQWLMFQMGGVGPMMGQAGHFKRAAPEPVPYAVERYTQESRRLLEVLDGHLARSEFLAGAYSIADMATYPWVKSHGYSEIPLEGLSHLQRWMDAVGGRPAVQRGMQIPK